MLGDVREQLPRAQGQAGLRIHRAFEDLLVRRVGPVCGAAIRRETGGIGDRHVADDPGQLAGAIVVDCAVLGPLVLDHGADPERPGWVHAAVIGAIGGDVALDVGNRGDCAGAEIEPLEACFGSERQGRIIDDGGGSDNLVEMPLVLNRAVRACREKGLVVDVEPEQLRAPSMPERSFAKGALAVDQELCRPGHFAAPRSYEATASRARSAISATPMPGLKMYVPRPKPVQPTAKNSWKLSGLAPPTAETGR
ncbi:hypothetical protein D3C87_1510360 [compost metagenome]